MTRIGKIARLPRDLRHELNHRLADGEPGIRLVAWLNRQPVVQTILAAEFQGRPISPQNLSEWKTGGYQDWLVQQDTVALTRELADNATELAEAAGGQLADHQAGLLAARYARLLAQWDGEPDAAFNRKAQALRSLGQDVAALRRGDQAMERLRLEQEKYAVTLKARGLLALEAVLEEVKRLPDVADAFDKAFALFREHQPETPLIPEAATPIRPNPREAGWDAYSGTEAPEPETGVPTTNAAPATEAASAALLPETEEIRANQTESNQSAPEVEGDAALPPAPPTPEATSPEAEPPAPQETGEIRPDQTESNQIKPLGGSLMTPICQPGVASPAPNPRPTILAGGWFAPLGLGRWGCQNPRLAPWATIGRCSAALPDSRPNPPHFAKPAKSGPIQPNQTTRRVANSIMTA